MTRYSAATTASAVAFAPRKPLSFYERPGRLADEAERPAVPLPALPPARSVALSPRRQQVAALLARGFTNKEIAAHLGTSARTVENHRATVFSLLGLTGLARLTQYAIARGWIANEFCPHLLLLLLLLLLLPPDFASAQVALSWEDNSTNETGFRIHRAIGATGAFVAWGDVPANVVAYADTAVAPATTYRYRVTSFNAGGESTPSNVAVVTTGPATTVPAAPSGAAAEIPGDLVNVSTRGQITGTDTTIIPGFVVANGKVKVLVRVVGPTLGAAPFNVPGVCPDPRFELRSATGGVISSDNWSGAEVAAAAAAVGAFALPDGSKDAAVVVTLPPGTYTLIARSNTGEGIGLAEVYKVP